MSDYSDYLMQKEFGPLPAPNARWLQAQEEEGMLYWIIEHPTRGIFREWDEWDDKPRWSWSKVRSDETLHRFHTLESAKRLQLHILAKGISDTYILRAPTRPEQIEWVKEIDG